MLRVKVFLSGEKAVPAVHECYLDWIESTNMHVMRKDFTSLVVPPNVGNDEHCMDIIVTASGPPGRE